MHKLIFSSLFLLLSCITSGQVITPTDIGSKVKFAIKNFGINTRGTFEGLSGNIVFDPNDLPKASFNVSIESKTVDTDITARDNHIRKAEYLDVEKFPQITFKSTKVTTTTMIEYLYVFGTITIKDVTQEVKFPFKAIPKDGGYLFEGEFQINRRDFGVGGKSFSLSDDLKVELSVFAK